MFVVLREVETYLFAVLGNTHWNKAVDEFVAQPAHAKCIGEYYDDSKQVVEKYDKAIPCSCHKSFLNEDTCQYGAEDAACSVGGEDVKCIVYAGVGAPIYRNVADECDDEGYEDALSYRNIAC